MIGTPVVRIVGLGATVTGDDVVVLVVVVVDDEVVIGVVTPDDG